MDASVTQRAKKCAAALRTGHRSASPSTGTISDARPLPGWRRKAFRRRPSPGCSTTSIAASRDRTYDRFSRDPEKRTALEAWERRLLRILAEQDRRQRAPVRQARVKDPGCAMPSTRSKKPRLAAEPCVVHPDGTVSDAEIWADILGDDVAPWDTTTEAQIARGTTPSAKDEERARRAATDASLTGGSMRRGLASPRRTVKTVARASPPLHTPGIPPEARRPPRPRQRRIGGSRSGDTPSASSVASIAASSCWDSARRRTHSLRVPRRGPPSEVRLGDILAGGHVHEPEKPRRPERRIEQPVGVGAVFGDDSAGSRSLAPASRAGSRSRAIAHAPVRTPPSVGLPPLLAHVHKQAIRLPLHVRRACFELLMRPQHRRDRREDRDECLVGRFAASSPALSVCPPPAISVSCAIAAACATAASARWWRRRSRPESPPRPARRLAALQLPAPRSPGRPKQGPNLVHVRAPFLS